MKNSKKMFILIEAGLAALVLVLALCTVWEKNGKNRLRVSVIIQNSNASQWSAFKYGLRMAAEDQDIELFVVSTVENMTAGQEKELIMNEAAQGADALILQPVPGLEETGVIQEVKKKIPVMLIEPEDPRADQYPCPSTQPDQYALGNALARELVNDYDGKMDGKTVGILSKHADSKVFYDRRDGAVDGLKETGARIRWFAAGPFQKEEDSDPGALPEVDIILALDDGSLIAAGESAAANDLHGALVYGIGHSTEGIYYLDTGRAECVIVPDEFKMGYQSLEELCGKLKHFWYRMEDQRVAYTVIRRDTLFTKENQELLFTMSQ